MIVGEITILRPGQAGQIDLCTVGSPVVWDATNIDAAVVQLARPGTTYPTNAQATVKGSNDLVSWVAIDGGVAALTAASASAVFDTTGFAYVCLETTTVGTGTAPIPFFATLFGRPGVKA